MSIKLQKNLSEPIFSIISGSIRSGGSLLFLEDGMTLVAKDLLQVLTQNYIGKITFAVKPLSGLLNMGQTQCRDVLFVGDISKQQAQALAEVCVCKVVKDKGSALGWSNSLFDAEWDPLSFSVSSVSQLITEVLGSAQVMKKERLASALFLDRDDVIVRNVPYNKDPEQVVLMPGVVELIKNAHHKHELVIICSNQSGIGRGLVTQQQYQLVHQRMLQLLAKQGAWVDDCYWASYIDDSVLQDVVLEPQLRKPRPGMFILAAEKWSIDMRKSRMIGDSATDLLAAYHSGIRDLYLFASKKVEQEKVHLADFQKCHEDFKFQLILDLIVT